MKKLVPDPPHTSSPRTAHIPFGSCNGNHPPLFAVCAGADFHDALVHLSASLTLAAESNFQLSERIDQPLSDLVWATQQSLEMSQALVASMLNSGLEQTPST